jgi:hypothetical protein
LRQNLAIWEKNNMRGNYRWVRYTVDQTDHGYFVNGDEIGVAGPFSSRGAAHQAAQNLIDEMLDEQYAAPPQIAPRLALLGVAIIFAAMVVVGIIFGG